MIARVFRTRAHAQALRAALSGASAIVLLAGVSLPIGLSPAGLDLTQKTAQAKGGGAGVGPGGNGPPGLSVDHGGGNGNGGGISATSHGDGEDGDHGGKDKLGKFNAANAAGPALLNANPNSTVGQIAIYKQMVEDEEILNFEDAKEYLDTFANKEVTEQVVADLNALLGLDPFVEAVEPDPDE